MENMNYEFKDMTTIEVAEEISELANVLVEDGGVIKRAPKNQIVDDELTPEMVTNMIDESVKNLGALKVTEIIMEQDETLTGKLVNMNPNHGLYLIKPENDGSFRIQFHRNEDGTTVTETLYGEYLVYIKDKILYFINPICKISGSGEYRYYTQVAYDSYWGKPKAWYYVGNNGVS